MMQNALRALVALSLAQPLVAQTALVESGDIVPGVGAVLRIDEFAINDDGDWLVEVRTDHPDEDQDQLVLGGSLGSGFSVIQREGQPAPGLAGEVMGGVHVPFLDDEGRTAWRLRLATAVGLEDDAVYYHGSEPLLREGELVGAQGLPADALYGDFDAKTNTNGETFVIADLMGTGVPFDFGLFRIENGTSELIVRRGDFLPGQVFPVQSTSRYNHAFDINDLGDIVYRAGGAVYLNDNPIAQIGVALPALGDPFRGFGNVIDLNDNQDWVLLGELDVEPGRDLVIVHNGEKVVQEGDLIPEFGLQIQEFGEAAPIVLSNGGEVFWLARFQSDRVGLFVDDELLVRQGVTDVNGVVIDDLRTHGNSFATSPNGRYLVFEAVLVDGTKGAYVIDRGTVASQELRNGSGVNDLCLRGVSLPVLGNNWTLELDSRFHLGSTSAVLFGYDTPLESPLPIGELLVDVSGPRLFDVVLPALGGIDPFVVPIPAAPALLGRTAHVQALILGGTPELCNAVVPTVGF